MKSYGKFLEKFSEKYATREVISISADQIGRFLDESTKGLSRATHHLRYAQIKAFFNYVIEVTGTNAKLLSWPRHIRTCLIGRGRSWTRRP